MERTIEEIVQATVEAFMNNKSFNVEIEVSGRHVHLSQNDVEKFFGKDYELTFSRPLSQPGQYLCNERINIMGSKGILKNVAILGPTRKETQVELSKSDAISIGVDAPLRSSGDINSSGSCLLTSGKNIETISQGVIVAKNHIHMSTKDANVYNIVDGNHVDVEYGTERKVVFKDVLVRVSDDFETRMHIDFDEANAIGFDRKNPNGKVVFS